MSRVGVYLRGSFITLRRMTTSDGGFVRLVRLVCCWRRTEGVIFVVLYRMWSRRWGFVACEGAQPSVGVCALPYAKSGAPCAWNYLHY